MTRKIIQLTVSAVPEECDCVYALCDDGSVWSLWRGAEDPKWERIEDISQDNEVRTMTTLAHKCSINPPWAAAQIERLEAKIERVELLPDMWRAEELATRTATPEDPTALDGDDCADQLHAAIHPPQEPKE